MKLRPLHFERIDKLKEGVTYQIEQIVIAEDSTPIQGCYIPGERIIKTIHLDNETVRTFQKEDKTIDYDKIEIHCYIKLLVEIKNYLYKNYIEKT